MHGQHKYLGVCLKLFASTEDGFAILLNGLCCNLAVVIVQVLVGSPQRQTICLDEFQHNTLSRFAQRKTASHGGAGIL